MLTWIALGAGLVHVLAPDHWLPASIMAWQRGWTLRKTIGFAAALFLAHLSLGAMIYFTSLSVLKGVDPFLVFRVGLLVGAFVVGVRVLRFSRILEFFRLSKSRDWGFLTVGSLLGPCESLIPILLKARLQLQANGAEELVGFARWERGALPVLAFSLGTLVAGIGIVVAARVLWNQPFWLPRGIRWLHSRVSALPYAASLLIALLAVIKIPH